MIYVKGCTLKKCRRGPRYLEDEFGAFLCHATSSAISKLLCGEKYPPSISTGCVGGMKEALFQSASLQQSCCSCFHRSGGSLTLSFLLCDIISRNSLHGFYKQLCKTDSARNEADAWSQTHCMKLAVSLLLLHLTDLAKSLLRVSCSVAVFHTVSFYVLFVQVFTQYFMPLHLEVDMMRNYNTTSLHNPQCYFFSCPIFSVPVAPTSGAFSGFLLGRHEKEQNEQQRCFCMEMCGIWGSYTLFVRSRPVYRKEIKGS